MGKSKADSFVWTDDEVELLLKVTIEYNVCKTLENVDWESCMPDKVLRYSGSFCSAVSFATLDLALFFAQLSSGVGWTQHCDVIVFEKFCFHCPHENGVFKDFHSGARFEKLRFRSPFSPDTCGRKANPRRKSCVFKRR